MILHMVAGLVGIVLITVHTLLGVLYFGALGYFFEKTQHRYVWSVSDGELHREKTGWTGWITNHRLKEAAGWPLGALIASIALMIMKALGIDIGL